MKKKIFIVALILIVAILAGIFIYSRFLFNMKKSEAFNSAIKVCERNLEIAQMLDNYIEQLENYEKNGFKDFDKIEDDFFKKLKFTKTQLQRRCETDCKYMYDLLKDYTDISESGVKTALESYLYSNDCLFEATLIASDSLSEDEKKIYDELLKTAKSGLKFGKDFFNGYLNKLKK